MHNVPAPAVSFLHTIKSRPWQRQRIPYPSLPYLSERVWAAHPDASPTENVLGVVHDLLKRHELFFCDPLRCHALLVLRYTRGLLST